MSNLDEALRQFEAVAASQIVKAFPGNVFFSRGGGIESLSDGNDESRAAWIEGDQEAACRMGQGT